MLSEVTHADGRDARMLAAVTGKLLVSGEVHKAAFPGVGPQSTTLINRHCVTTGSFERGTGQREGRNGDSGYIHTHTGMLVRDK